MTSPSLPWSRRAFLATSAAVGAALTVGVPRPAAAADGADEFARLRAKWRALYLGEGFSPTAEPFRSKLATLGAQAKAWQDAMAPATGSLWPDAVFGDPEPDTDTESYGYSEKIQTSYERVRTMAEAFCQPGTGLTGDTSLKTAVLTAVDHLGTQVYNKSQTQYGNWYNFQIGAPQRLLDICVLMYEHLSQAQLTAATEAIDHFVPDSLVSKYTGTSTGANRIDLCRVLALRGILDGTAAKVALARDAVSPVFPYVTSGDGLYADGSLIQHTYVPYTGSYGAVLIDGLSRLFALLGGSTWAITDSGRQIFLDSVESAYAPFLHDGLMMDNVSGRAISRGLVATDTLKVQQDDHSRGHGIIASILLLGQGASAEENARWQALAKGWFTRDRYSDVTSGRTLGVAALSRVATLLDDSAVKAGAEPTGHKLFPSMARAAHRTSRFTASVSMSSKAITFYENGNGENIHGWHTGSGMLYWWAAGDSTGGGQYSDGYWPTVDPYRLPGTTVSRKKLADGEGGTWGAARPDTTWVGGTTDGTYAAVAQDTRGLSSTLRAKKSWFFLDDAVVCLGAGITSTDGAGVESVVDNRNLGASGTARLTVDGRSQPSTLGWNSTVKDARWAHLAGHGGYLFPGGASLTALREERTAAWQSINGGGSTDPVTRRYVTLLADHGTDPANASYAYVVLPGASEQRTAARALERDWMQVTVNSAAQQGVRVPSLGLTSVTFWEPGTVGRVSVDAPLIVQIRERRDGTATVCVSDPNRAVKGATLTWRRPVRSVASKPGSVTGAETGRELKLTFGDLSGTGGLTQKVTVTLA
ncbi:twin-arginine translocation signal domain-containing protein [Streptomyces sp. SID8379]|uniref:polysaccharide lyase 8 family protein n=1 Tax=unclassified Streptomyces TaxID=2593676 RepID=UPI0003797981|nr:MULTISPECIES: polysaccharide lyase 8 family protein [unclassified Streptomyces]MYW69918.1 twin-arginine translocation signal domain-containing protein [Streptomyces sp. SID8379]